MEVKINPEKPLKITEIALIKTRTNTLSEDHMAYSSGKYTWMMSSLSQRCFLGAHMVVTLNDILRN